MKGLNKKNIKRLYNVLIIIVLLLGVVYVFGKFAHFGNVEYTDNAQVYRHITPINTRVQGFIKEIRFDDYQEVHKGDTLVIIEDTEYQLQLSQAEANVASSESGSEVISARMNTQESNVAVAGTNVDAAGATAAAAGASAEAANANAQAAGAAVESAKAAVESASANLEKTRVVMENAKTDFDRYAALYAKEAVTKQQYDNAKVAYDAAKAQYDAVKAQYDSAKGQFDSAKGKFDAAKAQYSNSQAQYDAAKARVSTASTQKESTARVKDEQRHQLSQNQAGTNAAKAGEGLAKLRLSYTVIIATCDGKMGRKDIHVGQLVQPGQQLAEIVDNDNVWITANYRETQLANIKVGNKVEITADAVPDVKYEGEVEIISGATGAAFSKVPVDNATGNFVKVEQRIPVRIKLTKDNKKEDVARLLAGLNVETEVKY